MVHAHRGGQSSDQATDVGPDGYRPTTPDGRTNRTNDSEWVRGLLSHIQWAERPVRILPASPRPATKVSQWIVALSTGESLVLHPALPGHIHP
jgi:hypothetical protein